MDDEILVLLISDLEAQLALIEETFDRLEERASGLRPNDEARLESTAYQLHNLYNAVEDLFKIVADAFENQLAAAPRWHIRLLRRMSHDINGVRPALLSQESYQLLDGLRSFRHFFRHAYAAPIDYERLHLNLKKARQLRPLLRRDVDQFLRRLGKEAS